MFQKEIRIARQARQTKKNNELYTIHLRIFTYWGGRKEEFNLSTKQTVPIKQWDDVKKQAKGNSDEARRINRTVDQYIQRIRELFDNYKLTAQTFSASGFRAIVLQELFGINRNHRDDRLHLSYLFDRYVEIHKSSLGKSRINRYAFVKQNVIDFTTKELGNPTYEYNLLDRDWYFMFKEYLLDKYPYSTDTLTGYLKVLRSAVKDAYKSKLIKEYPFVDCPLEYGEHDIKYLNANELRSIEKFKSDDMRLQIVVDCFIFASHTGLSHSDLRGLIMSDIRREDNGWVIVKKRNKTDVESLIPVDKTAMSILRKYKYCHIGANSIALPIIYINEYNEKLKLIAAKCGIDRNLTSHIARHTFATTVWLNSGGSIEVLQKILGHKNIKTTQRYGRITAQRVVNEANEVLALAS